MIKFKVLVKYHKYNFTHSHTHTYTDARTHVPAHTQTHSHTFKTPWQLRVPPVSVHTNFVFYLQSGCDNKQGYFDKQHQPVCLRNG